MFNIRVGSVHFISHVYDHILFLKRRVLMFTPRRSVYYFESHGKDPSRVRMRPLQADVTAMLAGIPRDYINTNICILILSLALILPF